MKILLFRLLKEIVDGSLEIAGYEMHGANKIYQKEQFQHQKPVYDNGNIKWFTVLPAGCGNPIKYDRKDMWTGVTMKDGTKVFERDKGLIDGHHLGDDPVTVVYIAPSFKLRHANGSLYEINDYFYKVTGIEGVS